jgi:hypothetical protein
MSRGRGINCRPVGVDRVHCGRIGQVWQDVTGEATTTDSRPRSVHAVETAVRAALLGVLDAQRTQECDTEVALGANQWPAFRVIRSG